MAALSANRESLLPKDISRLNGLDGDATTDLDLIIDEANLDSVGDSTRS